MNLTQYPTGFAPQKPQQSISPKLLRKILSEGGITTRKYNGNRVHVLVDVIGDVRVFSRNGKLEWTACVPSLVLAIKCLGLPSNTFIDAELYVPGSETTEAVQLIVNSGSDVKGAQYEAQLQPNLAVFDILIWSQKPIHTMDYEKRIDLVEATFKPNTPIHPAEIVEIPTDYDKVMELIEQTGFEGFVLSARKATNKVNMRGNTKRGDSWKLKIRHTEDMVATGFTLVKDPTQALLGVGSLKLSRRTPSGITPVGKVGSFEVTFDRVAAITAQYPFVVEVSHFGLDERGHLEFPKIIRGRPDLAPDMLAGLIPLGNLAV